MAQYKIEVSIFDQESFEEDIALLFCYFKMP